MIRAAHMGLASLLLAGLSLVHAAEETPPAGTWKITLPFSKDSDTPHWLVKLEQKDGKWAGSVVANADSKTPLTLTNLSVTKELFRFSLKSENQTLPFEFRLPANKTAKLRGVLLRGGDAIPAELEQTTVTSLDRVELLKEALSTEKENAAVIRAALTLIKFAGQSKAKPEEVRSWAARAAKAADAYGPRWQRDIIAMVAEMLGEQKGYEAIALTYARQAERLLDDKDRPAVRKRVLDALASALTKAGKKDEAKEVEMRAKKINFTIKTTTFAGRKGKSDRVVLVELFTGAEHPPSTAAVLAFDALGKTFKPSEVLRLQYHLHVAGADPLANRDSEARVRFYRRVIEVMPSILLNGDPLPIRGGDAGAAWGIYDELVESLTPLLDTPAKAKVKATVTREGSKISINVAVSDVQADREDLRVRVALVEEQVAYTGANKVAEHSNVVRAFAGGAEGEKIVKDKPFTKTLTVDLEDLRKALREDLDKRGKETPFPNKERPLDLKKLRIVAFVQDTASREVLQAVQVDAPAK